MPNPRKPAPAGAEHAPLQLEHFLPYRLSILSNTISQAIADDYQRRYDISRDRMARDGGAGAFPRPVGARSGRAHGDGQGGGEPRLARLVEAGRVTG
jgi:hypothetical protein